MPIGATVEETGLLLREGRHVVLALDGGGRWRLDLPRRGMALLGQRVWIEGARSGFDLVDVSRMGRVGQPASACQPRGALALMPELALLAVAAACGVRWLV